MAGSEDNIPPTQRSADELVDLAHAKLDRLVRRRRVRFGVAGGAALSLVVVLAAVAVAQSARNPSTVLRTSAAQSLSSSPSTAPSSTVATLPNPDPLTTTMPGEAPSTSVAVVPTSRPVSSRGQTPTTATRSGPSGPSTPTSVPPSTTTTLAGVVECVPSDVLVTATSEKPSYAVGEPIVITTTVKNVSDHACWPPSGGKAVLQDPSDANPVLQSQGFVLDYFADMPWKPGQMATQTFTFTSANCTTPCFPVAPGTVEAVVSWDVASPPPQVTVEIQVG